jgi:hypothetical protein
MGNCKNCGQPRQAFMASKFVCLQCDEMLFDMEIEVDAPAALKPAAPKPEARPTGKLLRLVEKATPKKTDDSAEQEPSEKDTTTKTKKVA